MTCPTCHGCGYDESPHYYYGRAECPECKGSGRICPGGDEICPCQDGDVCHYEGPDAWSIPVDLNKEGDGETLDDFRRRS